jgi:hypothetical protein
VLCTTCVLVCFTSLNETRKEIVLLVTATCRSRGECSTNPMIRKWKIEVLGAAWFITKLTWTFQGSNLGLYGERPTNNCTSQGMYKNGRFSKHSQRHSQKQVTPAAARWLAVQPWASGMQEAVHQISCLSTCTFFAYTVLNFEKKRIPPHTSPHKHGTRYFRIV